MNVKILNCLTALNIKHYHYCMVVNLSNIPIEQYKKGEFKDQFGYEGQSRISCSGETTA